MRKRPIKLLVICPNPKDATSLYRGMGPLGHLVRENVIDIIAPQEINWSILSLVDIVFLQRPMDERHQRVIRLAKMNGKPVWIDFDDDIFAIPRANPAYEKYSSKSLQNIVCEAILYANAITVSTPALAESIQEILEADQKNKSAQDHDFMNHDPEKVVVCPNAYDEDLFRWYRNTDHLKEQNNVFLWRGSNTHDEDVFEYMEVIAEMINYSKNWQWLFVGSLFWKAEERFRSFSHNNVSISAAFDPIEYHHMVYSLKPALVHVPLKFNQFNLAKSNIAWIEGAHGGGACLGPAWNEWQRPGMLNYETPEQYRAVLKGIIDGEIDTKIHAARSIDYITNRLTLRRVNEIRKTLLDNLMTWSVYI